MPSKIFALIITAGLLLTSCGYFKNDGEIAKIEYLSEKSEYQLTVGDETLTDYLTVTGKKGIVPDDFDVNISDSSVVSFSVEGTELDGLFMFHMTAENPGEAEIGLSLLNSVCVSETLTVRVALPEVDSAAYESEKTETDSVSDSVSASDSDSDSDSDTEANDTLPEPVATEVNTVTAEITAPITESVSVAEERTVYITPSGKKYHFSKSCAGVNAYEVPLADALTQREPCKKCAGGK